MRPLTLGVLLRIEEHDRVFDVLTPLLGGVGGGFAPLVHGTSS